MSSTQLRVVHPRHAASLILWRQARSGPVEVLMGIRAAGHRFMPNRLVFPGGRVDLADRATPAATELRPETRAALERRAPARLARALAVAAARELEEETGLVLGGTRPALDRLDYLCRAVTPRHFPMRFNARFLLAPAEAATGTLAGSGELERLAWVTPEAVRHLPVAPITACVLAEFGDWVALPPAARPARPLICLRGAGTRCPEPPGPAAAP
ncbi:NUDIX domain-containing protein [Roseomonas sp. E05]|uniref:NUDIX hydrolase n=1 Tax=Roseomonas sp. E05 TaxID=3046310 RepID=UPI0024BB32BE|nr:NUDIX domain-containing protein [Roseomonas sp. E05]MDJ0388660.1 NUDIX domain-containing protein [Roseomonas sp. E05]